MVCLNKKCTEQFLKKKKVKEMNTKETDIVKYLKNKKNKKREYARNRYHIMIKTR